MRLKIFQIILFILFIFSTPAYAWQSQFISSLKNGTILVKSEKGEILLNHQADKLFIPASIQKIITSLYAIDTFGLDFKYETEFYMTPDQKLVMKGFGDPSLVSEEIFLIAQNLKSKSIKNINGIIVDGFYFDPNLETPGVSSSSDPYNAINGALIANFNTVYAEIDSRGIISSAEFQTPLTPLAKGKRRQIKKSGKIRFNIGDDVKQSAIYAGELLREFLKNEKINVGGMIEFKTTPENATLVYTHKSSKTLQENVKDCLKYSTNFMANQFFLTAHGEIHGGPVTWDKAKKSFNDYAKTKFGWEKPQLEDGSGLSRNNQISAEDMMIVLDHFVNYRSLMPKSPTGLMGKTGTLNGVSTLAGYFDSKNHGLVKFVLMINSPVEFDHRFKLADELMKRY